MAGNLQPGSNSCGCCLFPRLFVSPGADGLHICPTPSPFDSRPLSLSAFVCMHARPLAIDIHPRGTQGHRIKPTCRGLSRLSSPTTLRPLEPQHHLPLPAPEPVQLYLLVIAPPYLPTSEGNGAGWKSSLRPSTSATGEAPVLTRKTHGGRVKKVHAPLCSPHAPRTHNI